MAETITSETKFTCEFNPEIFQKSVDISNEAVFPIPFVKAYVDNKFNPQLHSLIKKFHDARKSYAAILKDDPTGKGSEIKTQVTSKDGKKDKVEIICTTEMLKSVLTDDELTCLIDIMKKSREEKLKEVEGLKKRSEEYKAKQAKLKEPDTELEKKINDLDEKIKKPLPMNNTFTALSKLVGAYKDRKFASLSSLLLALFVGDLAIDILSTIIKSILIDVSSQSTYQFEWSAVVQMSNASNHAYKKLTNYGRLAPLFDSTKLGSITAINDQLTKNTQMKKFVQHLKLLVNKDANITFSPSFYTGISNLCIILLDLVIDPLKEYTHGSVKLNPNAIISHCKIMLYYLELNVNRPIFNKMNKLAEKETSNRKKSDKDTTTD